MNKRVCGFATVSIISEHDYNFMSSIKSIILDGSNIIRSMYRARKNINFNKEIRKLEILCKYIRQYIVCDYDRTTLFLDGPEREIILLDGITTIFSGYTKADELIVNNIYENINKNEMRQDITLVTSDKTLIERSKDCYNEINICNSNDFLRYIGYDRNIEFF